MAVSIKPDGIANLVTVVVFVILDTIAVGLRLLAKKRNKRRLGSDDYWMLVALVFMYGWTALIIYSVVGISGTLDVVRIPDIGQMQQLTQILWIASPFFPLTITPLKISILCFYRLVFPLYWFAVTTYILSALCALWLFSGFWVIIFQCTPWRAVYDFALQPTAHCVSFGSFVFIYELLNACLDVAILVLPALVVPTLQLSLRRKVQVLMVFFMGGFVLITCVLRMVYTYNPKDPKAVPSYTKGMLWASIELGVAMICGNLPTYGPLIRRDSKFLTTISTWVSSLRGTVASQSAHSSGSYNPGSDNYRWDQEDVENLTKVSKGDESNSQHSYSMNTISVQNQVEVVSNGRPRMKVNRHY